MLFQTNRTLIVVSYQSECERFAKRVRKSDLWFNLRYAGKLGEAEQDRKLT